MGLSLGRSSNIEKLRVIVAEKSKTIIEGNKKLVLKYFNDKILKIINKAE